MGWNCSCDTVWEAPSSIPPGQAWQDKDEASASPCPIVHLSLSYCFRNPKTGKALGYWDDSLKFMGELDCFGNWKFQFGSITTPGYCSVYISGKPKASQWYIIYFFTGDCFSGVIKKNLFSVHPTQVVQSLQWLIKCWSSCYQQV